jgi:hypothetical protein
MELKEKLTAVAGLLRPFKQFLLEVGISDGDQIVYYGCPGTCTPFIELMGFATRDLPIEQVFVPFLDESKAKVIKIRPDVGMQVSDITPSLNPKIVILMGGLAMPNIPVSAEMAKDTISGYDAIIVGSCFMSMFEKAKWTEEIDFDLMIDAIIDPVYVWK